jgi:hypothetical protein
METESGFCVRVRPGNFPESQERQARACVPLCLRQEKSAAASEPATYPEAVLETVLETVLEAVLDNDARGDVRGNVPHPEPILGQARGNFMRGPLAGRPKPAKWMRGRFWLQAGCRSATASAASARVKAQAEVG